jgi:hypothetical protein
VLRLGSKLQLVKIRYKAVFLFWACDLQMNLRNDPQRMIVIRSMPRGYV